MSGFATGPLFDLQCVLCADPTVEMVAVAFAPTCPPDEALGPRLEILQAGSDRLCRKLQSDGHTLCSARIAFTRVWINERHVTADQFRQRVGAFPVYRLFGDLFDPPFNSECRLLLPLAAGWLTRDVLDLARGIRADSAFDGLPALADALEDAGCDESLILEHLRTCADHAPSCWAVEMILHEAG